MKIDSVIGNGIPLLGDDIDTDRIIPARFLKEISFDNMGNYVFMDERFESSGVKKAHPLNDPRYEKGSILIVGKNFGCGSSREHAPQAIFRYGVKAIIGESFAEIFSGNCKAIGLPAVRASQKAIESLVEFIKKRPDTPITINLVSKRVRYFEESFLIDIPEPQRESFLTGTWNVLGLLKENTDQINKVAMSLPYGDNNQNRNF
tara:strand:- start:4880 stop:5491 length:612 start_codon:yes stop_codon:yes gene_type:complete